MLIIIFSFSGPAHILCLTVASGWNKERCKPETEFGILLTGNFSVIYFMMRIHYPWPLLGILCPLRNSASKPIVFRLCFQPCCPMIVLLLILPMNFDITYVTKICSPNLILGYIHTPESLFNIET